MKIIILITSFILLVQIFWVIRLDYPPSFEQLFLPLTSQWQLWLLRLLTLCMIVWTFSRITRLMKPAARPFFWLFTFISPVFLLLSLSYPIYALKLCLIILIVLKTPKTKLASIGSLILIAFFLYIVNVNLLRQAPSIINKLSLSATQITLTDRFNKEYLLQPGNPVPLLIKRLAYNKYFFVLKAVSEEVIRFADLETLFFRENFLLDQKTVPIFYWGELGLLSLALWLWAKSYLPQTNKEGLFLFSSVILFVLTDDQAFLRYTLGSVFIIMIMAQAIPTLFEQNHSIKMITVIFIGLSLYGWLAHSVDRFQRPDLWIDNRPLIYQRVYNSLSLAPYSTVYITDVFGHSSQYCHFYLSSCQKFNFSNFQMTEFVPSPNVLYIGFPGNFFGIDVANNYRGFDHTFYFPKITVLESFAFRDNPANGYGQKILFAVKNKDYVAE